MNRTIPGIHHVTAIAGDPQANPGMGHAINEDEIRFIRGLLAALVDQLFGRGSATT